MRSIVFDELVDEDVNKVRRHLQGICHCAPLPDVFWLDLPDDLLDETQAAHKADCGPHRVSLILENGQVRLELLVRSAGHLRCACTGYANRAQRDFCHKFMDNLADELGVMT